MPSQFSQVAKLQYEIEGALAKRFAGALTPRLKSEQEKNTVGISAIDELLGGGLPVSGISELVGSESSGRTTVALSILARVTRQDAAAAWVDISDTFDPESAVQSGVDLRRVLWLRCGAQSTPAPDAACTQAFAGNDNHAASQHVPRGSGSPHPRSEAHGMSDAVASLLQAQPRSAAIYDRRARRVIGTPGAPNRSLSNFPSASPHREEQVPTDRMPARRSVANAKAQEIASQKASIAQKRSQAPLEPRSKPFRLHSQIQELHLDRTRKSSWQVLEKALRAVDLLLQAGGFSLLVLDLGSVTPEMACRIPLSTWFRFRSACERTRTTMVLLTQHPCAKSSAAMMVRMHEGEMQTENDMLTSIRFTAEVQRERNKANPSGNVAPIRKPPQSDRNGQWQAHAAWAVCS